MIFELGGITFAAWQYRYFLILLFVIIALLYWNLSKKDRLAHTLASHKWRARLLPGYSYKKNSIKAFLFSIGFFFLLLALFRPQWDKKDDIVEQDGRDLLIALDVSRSMLCQDIKPNRLEHAKIKIKKIMQLLKSDRIGLIIFSGSTIVQCPLTRDYAAFNLFLDQLDAQTIASGTTALDQAIKQAIEVFKSMPSKKNKLLVTFTDGEDFSSNLAQIKQDAQQLGLTIFTMGVGTIEGAPVPLIDEKGNLQGHQRDQRGNVVISPLNEGILRSLAADCGGIYISSTQDDLDIRQLVNRVELFEKERLEEKKLSLLQEQYHYFAAIAFICFIIEWLL